MSINIRVEDGMTILSNFGRLMNDPKHFDAPQEVAGWLDQGERDFVMELNSVHETGAGFLGLLTTITRTIRKAGGDVVIVRPSPAVRRLVDEMRMDDFWDLFDTLEEARDFYHRNDVDLPE